MQPLKVPTVKRNDSLDYLRGLAASGVMAYHLSLFSFGESDASTLIARIKIYGVSVFYVLSGLTLFIADSKLQFNKQSLTVFYLKRFFRIFPLLWLATFFTYLLWYEPEMYSFKHLIVNTTILPGMIRPDALEANGAWSIGNELFFYLFFPVLFFLNAKNRTYFVIALITIFAAFALFTFKLFDPSIQLGYQWSKYVNPFNQFFFFAVGIFIATLKKPSLLLIKYAPLLICLFFAGIIFYPASGEPIVLVTGITRLVLSLFTIILCYLFYISDFHFLPLVIRKFLKYLGEASYSIYLIHPLVYLTMKQLSDKYWKLNVGVIITLTVLITLILSKIVYEYFEKYFIQKGKLVINKKLLSSSNK